MTPSLISTRAQPTSPAARSRSNRTRFPLPRSSRTCSSMRLNAPQCAALLRTPPPSSAVLRRPPPSSALLRGPARSSAMLRTYPRCFAALLGAAGYSGRGHGVVMYVLRSPPRCFAVIRGFTSDFSANSAEVSFESLDTDWVELKCGCAPSNVSQFSAMLRTYPQCFALLRVPQSRAMLRGATRCSGVRWQCAQPGTILIMGLNLD